jgi:hypothetical protein
MTNSLIIGYTSGIGKAIYDECNRRPENVASGIGSKEQDNINDKDTKNAIVSKAIDMDHIYIIPAGKYGSQIELLCDLYEAYKDTPKKIIVISSSSPEQRPAHKRLKEKVSIRTQLYDVGKYALDKFCLDLNHRNDRCQIINIKPGAITGPKKHLWQGLDVDKLANTICNIVDLSSDMKIISTTIIPY